MSVVSAATWCTDVCALCGLSPPKAKVFDAGTLNFAPGGACRLLANNKLARHMHSATRGTRAFPNMEGPTPEGLRVKGFALDEREFWQASRGSRP